MKYFGRRKIISALGCIEMNIFCALGCIEMNIFYAFNGDFKSLLILENELDHMHQI